MGRSPSRPLPSRAMFFPLGGAGACSLASSSEGGAMKRVWILVALGAWAVGDCSEPRPSEGPADGFEHHTPDGFENEDEEDVEDEVPVHFGDDLADNRQVYEQDGLEP